MKRIFIDSLCGGLDTARLQLNSVNRICVLLGKVVQAAQEAQQASVGSAATDTQQDEEYICSY